MIGKDGTLANIWTLISHVAPSDATVLITGESGAGKEVIADEIYRNSNRNDKPFVKSTVRQSRHTFWNPNYSVMKKVPFPVRIQTAKRDYLNRQITVR